MNKYPLSFIKGTIRYYVSRENLSLRVLNYFTHEPCIVYPESLVKFSGLPVFHSKNMSEAEKICLASSSKLYKNELFLSGCLPVFEDCCFGWYKRGNDFYRPMFYYDSSYFPEIFVTEHRYITLENGVWVDIDK